MWKVLYKTLVHINALAKESPITITRKLTKFNYEISNPSRHLPAQR